MQKALIDLYLDEGLYAEAEAQAGKAMKSVRARVESGEGATDEDFDLFVTAAANSATVAMEKSLGNATLEVTEAVSHYDAAIWALSRWFSMRPTGEVINRERHRYADIQFKRAAALARFGTRESLREAERGLVNTLELFFDELAGYPVAADTPPHAFVARSSAPSFFTVESELVSIASLPGTADDRLASFQELGSGSSYTATVDEARVKVFDLADRSSPIATVDTKIDRLHSAVRLAGGNILARSVDHNLHLISADGGADSISEEGDAPLLLAVAGDTTQDKSDSAKNRFLFGREGDPSLSKAENGAAVVKLPLNSDDEDCFLAAGGPRISPDGGRFAVAVRHGGVESWIVAPWSSETLSCSSSVHTGPGDLTFTSSGVIVIFDRTSGNLRTLENAQDGRWESRVLVDAPALAGAPLSFLWAGEDTFALLDSSKELSRVELVHRPADGSGTKFASHSISPDYEPWSVRVTGLGFDPHTGRFIVDVLTSARPGGLVAYVVAEASGVLPILEVATSRLGDDQQQQVLFVDGPAPQLVWLDVNGALHQRMAGAEDDEELVSSLELERADTLLARAGEGWVEIAVDAEGIVLGVGWWRGMNSEPEAWGLTGSQSATGETEETPRVEDQIGTALRSTELLRVGVHDAQRAWRPLSQRLTSRGVQVAGLWAEEPADEGGRVISVLPMSNLPDAKPLRFTVASDAVPIGLLEPSGVLLTASDAEIAAYDVEGRLGASGLDGFAGADAEVLVGQDDRFAVFGVASDELRLALFVVQETGIETLACGICDEIAFDGVDDLLTGALSDMFRDGATPFVLSSDLQSIASLVQGGVRYGPISTPTFTPQRALPVYVARNAGFFVRAPNRTEVRFLTASQLAAAANAQ